MQLIVLAVAYLLRTMPNVRGRHRLERWWLRQPRPAGTRMGRLPGGARVGCDWSIPFEAMVWLGREEDDDLAALMSLLAPGESFVDVGANIGTWTLQAATRVGPTGHIFAFEPNPTTAAKLRENVHRNQFEARVTVTAAAVGDCAGTVFFECHREHNLSHISPGPSEHAIAVNADTLDRYLGSAPVHGMKIDVEGNELAVLVGAKALLARSRPWIVVEFNLDTSEVECLGDWPVHRWLRARGYQPEPLPSTRVAKVTDAYRPPLRRYSNVLYRPRPAGAA